MPADKNGTSNSTGNETEDAAYNFERNLTDMKRQAHIGDFDVSQPDPSLRGGTLLVLSLNRCRSDLSVLEEFSSLLRHASLLKSLEMRMTRHAARDTSQQPGFVEGIVTLAEAVANNTSIRTFELGDLGEVCNTAAVIAAPSSYQLAAIKRAIDGLNAIRALLQLDTAQQRLNWYAKHYFGGSDERKDPELMDGMSPLKSEESQKRSGGSIGNSDSSEAGNEVKNEVSASSPRSVRKQDKESSGATEAVSLHR
jgi:hypothetical protein